MIARPRDAQRGFTLIELAVTLLVLSLAAAVVVPGVGRSIESVRARAEISGFAAYLRAAREQAIARGEAQTVRLDPETRSLAITEAGSDAVRSTRSFNYLLRIEPEPPQALDVMFAPLGFSNGAIYHIQAPGDRHYLITVDPFTGRVSTRLADS
jgi:prepilin-type N-terminal cleavage/methylation domain-containing protein